MIKLAIFDLDGTLLNTIDDLAYAVNHALAQCQYPTHPIASYPMFVGNGVNKLIERALPGTARNEETVQQLRPLFIQYYNEHNADYSKPYEGIPALLHQLSSQGVLLSVASNKYHAATCKLISHYFPETSFAAVYGHRDNHPPKPDPSIVSDILKETNLLPSEALYIGDSGVDMETAMRAGVPSVGVTWGFRPKQELIDCGAVHIVNHANEIPHLFSPL